MDYPVNHRGPTQMTPMTGPELQIYNLAWRMFYDGMVVGVGATLAAVCLAGIIWMIAKARP